MSKAVNAMRGIRRKVRGFRGDGVASGPNRLLSISLTEKVPLSKDLRGGGSELSRSLVESIPRQAECLVCSRNRKEASSIY